MSRSDFRNPLLIAFLAFGFWLLSDVQIAQYMLIGALATLTLLHPLSGILFLMANETYIGTVPPVIGGISLAQIIGCMVLVACLGKKRRMPPVFNWISALVVATTIVYFFSYYSYFGNYDFSILNNAVLFYLLLWAVDFNNVSALRQIAFTMLFTNFLLIIISFGYFIGNLDDFTGGPFGNARQVGFFGILSIPYLYVLLVSFGGTKRWRTVIYTSLFVIMLYNVITNGRLNLAIIFFCLIVFCTKIFTRPLMPRKMLIGTVIVIVTLLSSQQVAEKYLARGLVEVKSIGGILALDKADMDIFTSGRSAIYRSGWEMYHDFPLWGGGYKRWNYIGNQYNPFVSPGGKERISMHSTHLQYLAETGIIGLSLYWLLLGSMGYVSWRALVRRRETPDDPLYLYGCIGLFVSLSMFLGGVFDNHGILYRQFFLGAAVAAALTHTYHPSSRSGAKSNSQARVQ